MERGKKRPGNQTTRGQSTKGKRGRKPQAEKQTTPVSKIQKKRGKKTETATEANITDFFSKETPNDDDTDYETAPVPETYKVPEREPEIKSRVKRKPADISILPSQGTPFQVVQVQAEVYPGKSSSAISAEHSVLVDKPMGSRLGSVIGTSSSRDTRAQLTSAEGSSPYIRRGATDSDVMDTDIDTDASVVFNGSREERNTRSRARGGRIKIRPSKEVSTADEVSENERRSRSDSPELFSSPKLPSIWVEDNQQMLNPPTVRDDGDHGNSLDEDETQPLTPIEDTSTDDHEAQIVNPASGTNSQGVKRKEPVESLDLPEPKRRPVIFDFELKASEQTSDGRDSPLTPLKKLINKKRLHVKYTDPRPRMFAAKGTDPKKYTKTIVHHFEKYREVLREAQSRQPRCVSWGAPVVMGRHCAGTLDVMVRGQDLITNYSQRVENSDGGDDWAHVPKLVEKQGRAVAQGVRYVRNVLPPQDGQPTGQRLVQLIAVPEKYAHTQLPMEGGRSRGNPTPRLPRRGLARKAAPQVESLSNLFTLSDSDEENEFQSIPKVRKRSSKKDIDEDYVPETQDMEVDFLAASTLSQGLTMEHTQGNMEDDLTVVPDSQPLSPPVSTRRQSGPPKLDDETLRSASVKLTAQYSDMQSQIAKKVPVLSKTLVDTADIDDSGSNYDDVFTDKHTPQNKGKLKQNQATASKTTKKQVPRKKKQPLNKPILDNDFFESDSGNEGANSELSRNIHGGSPKKNSSSSEDLVVVVDDTDVPSNQSNTPAIKVEGHDGTDIKKPTSPTSARKRLGSRMTRRKVQAAGSTMEGEGQQLRDVEPQTGTVTEEVPGTRTILDRRGVQTTYVVVPAPKPKQVEKLVECPMCYKKFSEPEIQQHAFTCDGEKAASDDDNNISEPDSPVHNIQIQTLLTKSKTPMRVSQATVVPQTGSSQQAGDGRGQDLHGDTGDNTAGSSRITSPRVTPRVARQPRAETSNTVTQMLTNLPSTSEQKKNILPLPVVKIPVSACPMCTKPVRTDCFEQHVMACVDKAEALNAVKEAAVAEADEQDMEDIETMIRRPTRRRPLHQDQP